MLFPTNQILLLSLQLITNKTEQVFPASVCIFGNTNCNVCLPRKERKEVRTTVVRETVLDIGGLSFTNTSPVSASMKVYYKGDQWIEETSPSIQYTGSVTITNVLLPSYTNEYWSVSNWFFPKK